MSQYFGTWAREINLSCSNCCLEEYFIAELSQWAFGARMTLFQHQCIDVNTTSFSHQMPAGMYLSETLCRLVTVLAKTRLPSDICSKPV